MQIMLDRRMDHFDVYGVTDPLLDNVPIRSNFLLLLEPFSQVQYFVAMTLLKFLLISNMC